MRDRYTSSDIEVHLHDVTEGWDTSLTDVDATNDRYDQMVTEALTQAFPDYSLSVYSHRPGRVVNVCVVGYPDALDPEDIQDVIDRVYAEHIDEFTVGLEPCPSCGALLPRALVEQVPDLHHTEAWERLVARHEEDCEWVITRAHRVVDLGPITGVELHRLQVAPPAEEVWLRDADGHDYSGIYTPEMWSWHDNDQPVTDGWQRDLHLIRRVDNAPDTHIQHGQNERRG